MTTVHETTSLIHNTTLKLIQTESITPGPASSRSINARLRGGFEVRRRPTLKLHTYRRVTTEEILRSTEPSTAITFIHHQPHFFDTKRRIPWRIQGPDADLSPTAEEILRTLPKRTYSIPTCSLYNNKCVQFSYTYNHIQVFAQTSLCL